MTINQLLTKFENVNRDKKPISYYDFSDEYIIVEAIDKNRVFGNLYGVDKNTGQITLYGTDLQSISNLKTKKRVIL